MGGLGELVSDGARLFRERPVIVVGAAVAGLFAVRLLSRDTDSAAVEEPAPETGVGDGTFGLGYGPGLGGTGLYADGGAIDYGYVGDLPGPGTLPPPPVPVNPPLPPGPPVPAPAPPASRPPVPRPGGSIGFVHVSNATLFTAISGAGSSAPRFKVPGPTRTTMTGYVWLGPAVLGRYGTTARRSAHRVYLNSRRWSNLYLPGPVSPRS